MRYNAFISQDLRARVALSKDKLTACWLWKVASILSSQRSAWIIISTFPDISFNIFKLSQHTTLESIQTSTLSKFFEMADKNFTWWLDEPRGVDPQGRWSRLAWLRAALRGNQTLLSCTSPLLHWDHSEYIFCISLAVTVTTWSTVTLTRDLIGNLIPGLND